jgi:hypothetical protein
MTDAKNREVDPRWHTAIHEAGHVVVARALRRGVTGITIEEGADSLGQARIAPWPKGFDPDLAHSNSRFRRRIEDQIMIFCAGGIAEERVNEDKVAVDDGSAGDYEKAHELALLASSGNDDEA